MHVSRLSEEVFVFRVIITDKQESLTCGCAISGLGASQVQQTGALGLQVGLKLVVLYTHSMWDSPPRKMAMWQMNAVLM